MGQLNTGAIKVLPCNKQTIGRKGKQTKKNPSTKQFPKKSALFGFMGAKDQQYILNVNMALYIYTLPKKEQ